jgi:cytochrome d ubiquinol oxidase subunit I
MTDLVAARAQMALSLAFHIVFAAIGMAMPLLMVIAEARWLRRRDPLDLVLAKRWAKGTAILFAIGAVSGTALSFELGLLWPTFMRHAGPIVGMPFSLEGFAFFLEAIFLGIYLYGWERVSPQAHLVAGVLVALFGMASGALVIAANGWMNTPQGFDAIVDGVRISVHRPSDWPEGASLARATIVEVRPWEAMLNPAFPTQAAHMVLAALAAVSVAVAGLHALLLLRQRGNRFHERALATALPVALVCSLAVPVSGDLIAKQVAASQPLKLAAMEGHWTTEAGAPILVGGWVDEAREETRFALAVPRLLSVLSFGRLDATVRGIKEFPPSVRPPIAVTHLAFDLMVGCGLFLILVTAVGVWRLRRGGALFSEVWPLRLLAMATPLGFVAIEAGWVVTEVGRQPFIAQGMMRTAEALTPMPHLGVPLGAFGLLYLVLGIVTALTLRGHVLESPTAEELVALESKGSEGAAHGG